MRRFMTLHDTTPFRMKALTHEYPCPLVLSQLLFIKAKTADSS